jgi:3alpha(or 20beta)-hydroxysteroid dehydrogenase
MGRLDDRVAIVTGCARGTGEAIVRRFVDEGARVLGIDVLDQQGIEAAAVLGPNAIYQHGDVANEADWAAAIAEVEARWGRLDVLVNNAAILYLAPIEDLTADDFRRTYEVNLIGAFLGIKSCLPALRAQRGAIVNVGSIDSMSATPTTGAYSASKFAMRGLTRVVAIEQAKHGVRCNIMCPGGSNSEMSPEFFARYHPEVTFRQSMEEPRLPVGRRPELSELAAAVLFLASDDSSHCTGTELVVDGGLHAGSYFDVPGMFSTKL